MDNVDITAGSSDQHPGLRLLVGSADWAWLCAVRESEQAALAALQSPTLCHPTGSCGKTQPATDLGPSCADSKRVAKVERAAKARKVRTERLQATVATAVEDHRAGLQARPRGRAGWLLRQIELKHRLGIAGYELVPGYRFVLEYLKHCSF